jgi:hypothetical protein
MKTNSSVNRGVHFPVLPKQYQWQSRGECEAKWQNILEIVLLTD